MSQDKAIAAALEALDKANKAADLNRTGDAGCHIDEAIALLSNIDREPVEHAQPEAWCVYWSIQSISKNFIFKKKHVFLSEARAKEFAEEQEDVSFSSVVINPLFASPPPAPSMPEVLEQGRDDVTNCSTQLRLAGKPYPRTCKACGFGPCKLKEQSNGK